MVTDLEAWLTQLGLSQYLAAFRANDVSAEMLLELTEEDLRELGITLGHRKMMRRALDALATEKALTPGNARQRDRGQAAERRQLTVMFCDLVGSTALSVLLDPEDLREVIHAYQDCCVEVVKRYNGFVARFMGDGVMLYFGYPVAHENDAELAARAGLALVESVQALKNRVGALSGRDDVKLEVRVGVATGEVVVGDLLHDDFGSEQGVVGRTPNLAARLQGLAKPGEVVVSDTTQRIATGLFDYEDLGQHELKGFVELVPAWRVVSERSIESRFDAVHSTKQMGPLVGRESELERLRDYWSRTTEGAGQIALVGGEPGIGKSRLAHAVLEHVTECGATVLRYEAVPHYEDSVLYPVVKQLERSARIRAEEPVEARLSRLESFVRDTGINDVDDVVPLLAGLLSIPTADRFSPVAMAPEMALERTFDALERMTLGQASREPVLAVVEDLHWVDPVTTEFLKRLSSRAGDARLMLLLTHRTDIQPDFGTGENVHQLLLSRLNHEGGEALIARVLGSRKLPKSWVRSILGKTDGVPLFIEELTKNALESALTEDTDAPIDTILPSTLQDSLMARLDRMGESKPIAQLGATIGRQFSARLLAAAAEMSREELAPKLEKLRDADLVQLETTSEGDIYTFKHALVQDAAYASLLRARRRDLHRRIAATLQAQFPQRVETEPETLGHHYTEAGAPELAIPYWQKAADLAANRAAHPQAISHVRTALELLSEVQDEGTRNLLEVALRIRLAVSLSSTQGYSVTEVVQAYERARTLCTSLGDSVDQFPILSGLVSYYVVRGEHLIAEQVADQCIAYAEQSGRSDYLIDAERTRGYAHFFLGRFAEAATSLERSVDLWEKAQRPAQHHTAEHPVAASLALLPIVLWHLGRTNEALERERQGIEITEALNHPYSVAFARAFFAVFRQLRGESDLAVHHAAITFEVSSTHGFHWIAHAALHMSLAQAMLSEEPAPALEVFNQTLPQYQAAGAQTFLSYYHGGLSLLHRQNGDLAAAEASLETALEYVERNRELFHAPSLFLVRAELRADSRPESATTDYVRAIELAAQQGSRATELGAALAFYRHSKVHGDPTAAKETLRALCDDSELDLAPEPLAQAREIVGA